MWEDNLENEEYERLIYDYDFSEFSTGAYDNAHDSRRNRASNRFEDDEDDLTVSDTTDD